MPAHAWLYLVPAALLALLALGWALSLRGQLRDTRDALAAARDRLVKDRGDAARLAGRAVSELERPVKLLGASLDLALRRRRDTPELAASLEEARREVDRLATLAARILLLVEPRRERAPGDLAVVVRAAVEAVRPQAAARQVNLLLDGPHEANAPVDAKALQQAVMELLTNAIRVSRFGATVRVSLADPGGGKLRVKVMDDGPGFGNALPETVFEPFLYHRTAPAAGLGLALARKVAREHGGDVSIAGVRTGAEVVMEIAAR
jgi:signal transduction histidine kinase